MKSPLLNILIVCILCNPVYSQMPGFKAFPLSSVRLLNSPFKQAQETDLKYMLALNTDRLLAPYLKEAGIETKAQGYGNWEGTGLNGHIGGHYLSALSNMVASTGNKDALYRLNYMVDWLDSCQQKNGDGYVGGIPGGKAMWQDIAQGKINAGSFSLNDKWVPLYNIHKLYAGLVDAYKIAGNQKAKSVLISLTDWFLKLTSGLSDEQVQRMLRSEHGGMNEVFADVAEITGDNKYLELARRFSHRVILRPLLMQQDSLTGMHANTQIPKVIGFARIAEFSGDKAWENAADFFWNTVVNNRTVSIGGNSVREHFNPTNNFSSMIESKEGPETCNSYNMLKLTKQLFLSNPSGQYMDYYERTLYNHILSSQRPEGGFVYFTPMRPQHYRVYSQPEDGFWCCVGSGLENHGKYGELIYAHDNNDIFVNLFIPSVLTWKEKGMLLTQSTKFPFDETSQIKLQLTKPTMFAINVRYPSWVKAGQMKILVNNKFIQSKSSTSSYVRVQRLWKPGDLISIELPMQTKVEYLPDSSSWATIIHGPVVLAAATDTTDMIGLKADGSRMGHIANGSLFPLEDAPMIVSDSKNFASAIRPVKGEPLTYKLSALIYPNKYKNLKLVPFFRLHDTRYMLYWSVTNPENLAGKKLALQQNDAGKLALERQTVDQVAPGEQQPETDHNFQGEKTETGIFNERHWRHTTAWFSYQFKNPINEARKLRVTYYGKDKGRNFDIFINDVLMKTENLQGVQGDTFFDAEYQLPVSIVSNSSNKILQVKFVAHPGSVAGGVYYVRLMSKVNANYRSYP